MSTSTNVSPRQGKWRRLLLFRMYLKLHHKIVMIVVVKFDMQNQFKYVVYYKDN